MRGSGERLHGMQEVTGSIPVFSTKKALYFVGSMVLFFFAEAGFWGCIASPAPFSGFCRRFLYNSKFDLTPMINVHPANKVADDYLLGFKNIKP